MRKPFRFPKQEIQPPLKSILDTLVHGQTRDTTAETVCRNLRVAEAKWKKKGINMWRKYVAVDIGASPSRPNSMRNCLPCLTATRAASCRPFITCLRRQLSIEECLRAQGLDPDVVQWQNSLSERQLGAALGNCMTQPVLEGLVRQILRCVKNIGGPRSPSHAVLSGRPEDEP